MMRMDDEARRGVEGSHLLLRPQQLALEVFLFLLDVLLLRAQDGRAPCLQQSAAMMRSQRHALADQRCELAATAGRAGGDAAYLDLQKLQLTLQCLQARVEVLFRGRCGGCGGRIYFHDAVGLLCGQHRHRSHDVTDDACPARPDSRQRCRGTGCCGLLRATKCEIPRVSLQLLILVLIQAKNQSINASSALMGCAGTARWHELKHISLNRPPVCRRCVVVCQTHTDKSKRAGIQQDRFYL